MKHQVYLISLVLIVLSSMVVASTFTYQNPITQGIDPNGLRDCQVLQDGDWWYLTGTSFPHWSRQEKGGGLNRGVALYRSKDILNWEFVGYIVKRPGPDKWYHRRFWAPEIQNIGGKYYALFNCRNDDLGFVGQHTGYAVADYIEGPYTVVTKDKPLCPGNDLTFFEDDDGKVWAFWNRGREFGIGFAQIDLATATFLTEPQSAIQPGKVDYAYDANGKLQTEPAYDGRPKPKVQKYHTWDSIGIEGAYVIKNQGTYYLFYSSWTRGYEIGYATANKITGPWKKNTSNPFYGAQNKSACERRGFAWQGDTQSPFNQVGHNEIFEGPDGRYWLSCHGIRDDGVPMLVIDPLEFGLNQTIQSVGPTYTKQTVSIPSVKGKPNVIYILADDLGYGDLGCFGQTQIKTPHLDQLAAEGLSFTQHYSGSTVCAPSRCSLMTGRHGGRCSVRGNVNVLMKPDELTVAKVMKQAGYSTACIGKWGIGHPPPPSDPHTNGFDHFFGYLSMWHAHNFYPEYLWKNGKKVLLRNVGKHLKEHYKEGQEELTGYGIKRLDYTSDLFTQDGLEWISQQTKPFFLFLSYTIPHANNEAQDLGAEHGLEVPDYGIYANKNWPNAEKGKAAMISRLDGDIGRLVAKLKALGKDKDTLVIFTSDNGPHKEGGADPVFFDSNGPLRGIKRDLYEGGIRVPMIASWPGMIKAGQQTGHISAFWDLLPTLADLVNQPVPADIDGLSYLPTLLGKDAAQQEHPHLYWEFHEGSSKQAVRMGHWKAVRLAPSKPMELYDLSVDIGETKNIAVDHPDVVTVMKAFLDNARTEEEKWPLRDAQAAIPF